MVPQQLPQQQQQEENNTSWRHWQWGSTEALRPDQAGKLTVRRQAIACLDAFKHAWSHHNGKQRNPCIPIIIYMNIKIFIAPIFTPYISLL